MNLSEARDEFRARGFDGLTDSRVTSFLNLGKNALEDVYPFPWLEASTSGVAPLTISDLKAVLHVWDAGSNTSLEGADRRSLREANGPDLTLAGTAYQWYLDGLTTLNVYPADTSTTFSVDYIKHSPELSAAADEPLIPERLHPLWIDFSVIEAYIDADEGAMAQSLQLKAEARAQQAIQVYGYRNLQNPDIQPTSWWNSIDW